MRRSLTTIHRIGSLIVLIYIAAASILTYRLLDRWQESEEMAARSRAISSAITLLSTLTLEPQANARTLAQWQSGVGMIRAHMNHLRVITPTYKVNKMQQLLEWADEAYTSMHDNPNPRVREIYHDARAAIIQDLYITARHLHQDHIVTDRQNAFNLTLKTLGTSVVILLLLLGCYNLILNRWALKPAATMSKQFAAYGTGRLDQRFALCGVMEMDNIAARANIAAERIEALTNEMESEIEMRREAEEQLRMHERQLKEALAEKEVLLREIHHRVKNNMQVITSLLSIYSHKTDSVEVQRIFEGCRDRIDAMALIHESLYQSDNLSQIHFSSYLKKICHNLSRAYDAAGHGITLTLQDCEVDIDTDRCIAVGMILAELIANAFKHAFPSGSGGCVTVGLTAIDEDSMEISVTDDGVGLPEGLDIATVPSLGLRLAAAVITRDLGGTIQAENGEAGTRIVLRMPRRRKPKPGTTHD